MKNHFIAFLLFFSISVFSQGEAKIWYFGENAGLDFNSGTPVALTNGQIDTIEGCAVLSNNLGQLLFYTDGITVYNKNHQVMINGTGLMGHSSSTQSATIVQMPGNNNLYYIFTLDARGNPNGFRYSIVDMTLDGGNGAVTSSKNVLIYAPSNEKLAVVKKANDIDYWIVTHSVSGDTFYTHSLTSAGLNTTPIITNIGYNNPGGDTDFVIGYMKFSPNGKKIGIVHGVRKIAQLFDFDNVTGQITNPITLIDNSLLGFSASLYGIEFSVNSEVVYVSNTYTNKISQFDLTAANIPGSKIDLLVPGVSYVDALQLGPDNKIYIAHFNSNSLSVINSPNILGSGCNLQIQVVSLGGKLSQGGLPSFSQSFFFYPQFKSTTLARAIQ